MFLIFNHTRSFGVITTLQKLLIIKLSLVIALIMCLLNEEFLMTIVKAILIEYIFIVVIQFFIKVI